MGWFEPDPSAVAVGEGDLVAAFVDDDLVVEPAEHYQFFLVGLPALGPWGEMVDL